MKDKRKIAQVLTKLLNPTGCSSNSSNLETTGSLQKMKQDYESSSGSSGISDPIFQTCLEYMGIISQTPDRIGNEEYEKI